MPTGDELRLEIADEDPEVGILRSRVELRDEQDAHARIVACADIDP
jgi:hypothetical protein